MSNAELADDPFSSGGTLPEELPDSPWGVFRQWWDEAHTGDEGKPIESHPNAMSLATLGDAVAEDCAFLVRELGADGGRE